MYVHWSRRLYMAWLWGRSLRKYIRDIRTEGDCVRLMLFIRPSVTTSTDTLISRLVKEFTAPGQQPTDIEMQRLSLLYQCVQGGHGREEFAVTTLYAAATAAIMGTSV